MNDEQIIEIGKRHFREGHNPAAIPAFVAAVREVLSASIADTAGASEGQACHKCGLPMSVNPHPEAGKPPHYLEVGCPKECIPCLVKNRHGWATRAMKASGEIAALRERIAGMEKDAARWRIAREFEYVTDFEVLGIDQRIDAGFAKEKQG